MARIIGVEVPPNKRIEIALRYIYGIGPTNAKEVLARANIDPGIRAKDLTEQQLSQIVHAIQDGKYHIPRKKGVTVGTNRVELRAFKNAGTKIQDPTAPPGVQTEVRVQAFPPEFNDRSTVVKEVRAGSNAIDFDVDTKGKGK